MKQAIRTYGDPVLREKAAPVAAVTEEIRQLVRDMLDSMYAANGLGLAAEQIGRHEAICVIDIPTEKDRAPENPHVQFPLILINPEIVSMDGQVEGQEGCLSFPDIFVNVRRALQVTVRFTDLEGKQQTVTGKGLFARAVQHEVDHLNAVLLVDRMSTVQKLAHSGKLKRLKQKSATVSVF